MFGIGGWLIFARNGTLDLEEAAVATPENVNGNVISMSPEPSPMGAEGVSVATDQNTSAIAQPTSVQQEPEVAATEDISSSPAMAEEMSTPEGIPRASLLETQVASVTTLTEEELASPELTNTPTLAEPTPTGTVSAATPVETTLVPTSTPENSADSPIRFYIGEIESQESRTEQGHLVEVTVRDNKGNGVSEQEMILWSENNAYPRWNRTASELPLCVTDNAGKCSFEPIELELPDVRVGFAEDELAEPVQLDLPQSAQFVQVTFTAQEPAQ
jgi:hypothetical protein